MTLQELDELFNQLKAAQEGQRTRLSSPYGILVESICKDSDPVFIANLIEAASQILKEKLQSK